MQGLMVVGLIVEETLNVHIKCVKGTGAQNIGQGHRVKLSAESVHQGEALWKVWWLEVFHSSADVNYVKITAAKI